MFDSVWPHRHQPTRLPHPWDSPDKNTGVGCHLLLQCMKVKSESEVAQSCLTLCDAMDCSPPGYSWFNSWVRKFPWTRDRVPTPVFLGFSDGSDGKEFACSETWDWSLTWEDSPGGGHGNLLQYSCLKNPHGQRSLVGYSPWGSQRVGLDWATKRSTAH